MDLGRNLPHRVLTSYLMFTYHIGLFSAHQLKTLPQIDEHDNNEKSSN